ncbi:MAG: hypothetical protein M3Q39_15895 [Actinomycetota bacterium]|nr:hypothetical protein [Actinomycetota bacterium]
MTTTLPRNLQPRADHIVRVFREATTDQLAAGMTWYADAHTVARALDPDNPDRAAGILAALSPREFWSRNVTLAARVYSEGKASGSLTANCAKADRIFAGEDWRDVLGGDKVRTFAERISNPTTPTNRVVIDRHAFDIAVGRKTKDATRAILSRKGAYRAFEREYVRAAKILGVTPTQVQAVTWTVWREPLRLF